MNRSEQQGFEGELPPVTGPTIKSKIIEKGGITVKCAVPYDL